MSDRALVDATVAAATNERHATAELLELLGELDARRLYLAEGCSSLFTYCTQILHLSEHAAYHRIEAARAARQFPAILPLVADGSITLTTVALLRPHLTFGNHAALLDEARHKSKREVECQIARLAPRPDAKSLIRRLPAAMAPRSESAPSRSQLIEHGHPGSGGQAAAPEDGGTLISDAHFLRPSPSDPRPEVAPLSSDRFLLRITLSVDAHANLRRAQALLRHSVPNGDPAEVVSRALELLVNQLEKKKSARTPRPRTLKPEQSVETRGDPRSRHIPASVKRTVWERDAGRCGFVGSTGRCAETGRLEYHHVVPYARGGPADAANIALRCRAHNTYESDKLFGPWPSRLDSDETELDSR